MKNSEEVQFEIINNIGVLSSSKSGWLRELNIVSWSGHEPKYDLRDWSPDHSKMGKGVTLTLEELKKLFEAIEQEIKTLETL